MNTYIGNWDNKTCFTKWTLIVHLNPLLQVTSAYTFKAKFGARLSAESNQIPQAKSTQCSSPFFILLFLYMLHLTDWSIPVLVAIVVVIHNEP